MPADCTFVIVAAGRGERFGHTAKVLLPAAGKPLLRWSVDAAEAADSVRDLVIVGGEHTVDEIRGLLVCNPPAKPVTVVVGGATRHDSVAAGIAAVAPSTPVVLVHDAARPMVTPGMIERCAAAAREHGAAIAAMPVTDTLKRVTDCLIDETVPREHLWAAQTPQAFRRDLIVEALDWARAHPAAYTDEASVLEAMGRPVAIVEGAADNLKVTHPTDIALVEALLAARDAGT